MADLAYNSMQINYNREFRGPSRATKLGLTSSRFQEEHISKHAKEVIEEIKLKDRSYLKVLTETI